MKYIDADKLVVEIERRIDEYNIQSLRGAELADVRSFITSLQQEQPEVDLEEEIAIYLRTFSSSFENGIEYTKNIARRFYELGLNARNEK